MNIEIGVFDAYFRTIISFLFSICLSVAWAMASMFSVNFMVSDRHGFVFVGPFL